MNRPVQSLLAVTLSVGMTGTVFGISLPDRAPDGSLTIRGDDYSAALSPTGALLKITGKDGSELYSAPAASDAWVLNCGGHWIGAHALSPRCETRLTPQGVTVQYSYSASTVRVDLQYSFAAASEFTIRGSVAAASTAPVSLVALPGPLHLDDIDLRQIVFPYQRGIIAAPPLAGTQLSTTVPSACSDFTAFETQGGWLSISEPVQGAFPIDRLKTLAIYTNDNGPLQFHRDATVRIEPGTTWQSGVCLIQVQRKPVAAARRHWESGTTARYRKVSEKVAASTYARLQKSPLLKFPDGIALQRGLAAITPMLETIPSPAILHLCGIMEGGHDSNYPDYLPPDARAGTAQQLADLLRGQQRRGLLIAPYTNPTWWDPKSPTVKALGQTAMLMTAAGQPREERYGAKVGWLTDPTKDATQQRLTRTMNEMKSALGADLVFQDQVAARDYSSAGGGLGGVPYVAGLLANVARDSKSLPLMTEGGWDSMAEFAVAFCGNGTLDWEQPKLPADRWLPYPLMTILCNEHAVTFPHNLAGEKMGHSRTNLLYMAAMGNVLPYDLNRGTGPWLAATCALQERVFSRVFAQRITGFDDQRRTRGTTLLTYGNGDEVLGNWSSKPVAWHDFVVAPEAFAFRSHDGKILAGYFTEISGTKLPSPQSSQLLIRDTTESQFLPTP